MLWIDPDGLRANGAEFHDLGDQAQQTFETLRAALAKEGRCWGDDEPGMAFERNYLPDAERGLQALQQLADALQTFGHHLNDAAATFELQDQLGGQYVDNASDQVIDRTAVVGAPLDDQRNGTSAPMVATPMMFPPQQTDVPTSRVFQSEQTAPDTSVTSPSTTASPDLAATPISSPQPRVDARGPGTFGTTTQPAAAPIASLGVGTPAASAIPVGPHAQHRAQAMAFAPKIAPPLSGPRPILNSNANSTPWQPSARPTVTATSDRRAPNTPWSNSPNSGVQPWQRPMARTVEPRGTKPTNRRSGVTAPRTSPWRVATTNRLDQRVRDLADRHHLSTAGFDLPGLDEELVGEFVAAVHKVLTDYPMVDLRHIALGHLPPHEIVRAQRQRATAASSPFTWSIMLDLDLATGQRRPADIAGQEMKSGSVVAGFLDRPVFTTTLRELGNVLDVSGNRLARRAAQRRLIAEFLRDDRDYRRTNLGKVVRGYRRWRDQLCGLSFEQGCFVPAKALAWAFTDVVLNGPRATEPAQILHKLLIDAAQSRAEARRDTRPSHKIPI